jgi:hypothetical protein
MTRSSRGPIAIALVLLVAACASGPPMPERASSPRYRVGQVWRYQTRPGEEASRVIVGRIERIEGIGPVVHVKLTGLRLRGPQGVASIMFHAPVAEPQLSASVTELTGERGDLEGFADGYAMWRSAYQSGKAGVFTLPLAGVVDSMEEALNQ